MKDQEQGDRWGLVGHSRAVSLLQRSVQSGRVSHAYLFTGPRQVGKTTLALSFVRALNCLSEVAPCGQCRSCLHIEKGIHPDVRVLDRVRVDEGEGELRAGSGGSRRERNSRTGVKRFGIEDVRAMLRDAQLAPLEGRWKVYVLRHPEELKSEALQTLLKTLEEPPEHVILLLTTCDGKMLPPTIVSRCQQVNLGLVPANLMAQSLEALGADRDRARLLAHISAGRPGWAIEGLADEDRLVSRAQRITELLEMLQSGRCERLAYGERLATEFGRAPETTYNALELWVGWWRDVLLVKHNGAPRVVNFDREQDLVEQANRLQVGQILAALQGIRQALRQLQQNVNARLALEVMMLGLPSGAR